MSTSDLREDVSKIIEKADERFLKMVLAMAEAYADQEIVGYATDGTPLTVEDYNEKIQKAEDDIKTGKSYTTEEVRQKIKSWKKKYQK